MKTINRILVLGWLAANGLLVAAEPPKPPMVGTNEQGISLSIRCTNTVVKVGDEIAIEFLITNNGADDYNYPNRTYDRGGRMSEYALVARTESGETVPDPRGGDKTGRFGGGLHSPRVLHPGESATRIIALNLWALVKEPGRYTVVGTYPGVRSEPISIVVSPRTKEEMADYINGLTNQIAAQLAPKNGGPPAVSQELVMKLMYTCSPEMIPTLLQVLYQTNAAHGNAQFWATAALTDYVPHTEESRKAILEAVTQHGLNGTGLDQVLVAHEFSNKEMKAIIARALAADHPGEWRAAVWLALHYYDDAFTPPLIAIANDSSARWDTRSVAMRVLTFHRTDAGVKAIKALLKDPAPEMLRPLYETIANGYSSWDMAPKGKPLRPEDFSAEDMRPLIERLLVSTNQALQLQFSGVMLAKSFGSDALTEQLIELTENTSPEIRGGAISALALNRTDEGVTRLKMLLQDPDPKTSQMAEAAIRNAYTSRGDARGRPLRADDFDAKLRDAK